MKSVSIILPFYNLFYLVNQRLMELHRLIHTPVEIIVIDDYSTENVSMNIIEMWKRQMIHDLIYYRSEQNLGFGGVFNKGCDMASGNIYVLLSNDVKILYNFIPDVMKIIDNYKKVLIGNKLYTYDTGWNVFEINEKPRLFPYLAGHFIVCTKDVWGELGGFDEIYYPYDYEDVDISTMALYKGCELVSVDSKMLIHDHPGSTIRTIDSNRERITRDHREKFYNKWSEILKDE